MIPFHVSFIQDYVRNFGDLVKQDQKWGRFTLIATFATCFSMLDPENRDLTTYGVLTMIQDISHERFEDGTDFVDFLKQKIKEKTND